MERIEAAFDALDARAREVLGRFCYLGRTQAAIAAALGFSESNSKKIRNRARATLSTTLARAG